MTDRPNHQVAGEYTLRPDYDPRRTPLLHELAFEGIEELLTYQAEMMKHSYEDGVSRRELTMVGVENEPNDVVVFSDFTRLEVQRHAIQTEIEVAIAEHRHGLLRQIAQLTVRQYIADSAPFINEYRFELYAGGGRQAAISSTDVIQGQGLDTRPMTPYDYGKLVAHIERAAGMTAVLGEMMSLEKETER